MSDPVRIILLIVVLALVIGGGVAIYYQFFDKKEGTKCTPKDPVEHAASYEYDSEKECIAMTCGSGYEIVGGLCESTAPVDDSTTTAADGTTTTTVADSTTTTTTAADGTTTTTTTVVTATPTDTVASAISAPTAADCSQYFVLEDACHEADKGGIKWTWNVDAGETGTEGATCRNQVDHYSVSAYSSYDPNLVLATKIMGKNANSAGVTGFKNFFEGHNLNFKVMPKNAAGENLIGPRIPEKSVDSMDIMCDQKGIQVSPMAPNWNLNKNILNAKVYLRAGGNAYENIISKDAKGQDASYWGSGSQNVAYGKHYDLQVPLGGSIQSDCDNDGYGSFKLPWSTITEIDGFSMDKLLRTSANCVATEKAATEMRHFLSNRFE
jgi:hypothetical protein